MAGRCLLPFLGLVSAFLSVRCGAESPSGPSPTTFTQLQIGVAGNAVPTMVPGSTLQLWAVEVHRDGTSTDATNLARWETSDSAIATISTSGLLSAIASGSVTVTAIYDQTARLEAVVRQRTCADTQITPASLTVNSLRRPTQSYSEPTFAVNAPAGCAWVVTSDVPWLGSLYGSLPYSNPNTEGSGFGGFVYFVDANNNPLARTGRLHVAVGGRDLTFTVTQEAAHCSFTLAPPDTTVPLSGGDGRFEIAPTPENCAWSVDPDSAYPGSAMTVLNARSGVGRGEIRFSVRGSRFPALESIRIVDNSGVGTSPGARHIVYVGGH